MKNRSAESYVVGFLLSLIFTLVPYYLVAHQIVVGTGLLLTILAFAFVQLAVQITFFLHLGREPKTQWQLYFFAGTFIAIMTVVGGSIIIINNLHRNLSPTDQTRQIIDSEGIYQVGGERTGACEGQHSNHVIIIKDGKAEPLLTVATKCDTLTFTDNDTTNLRITFGTQQADQPYAGLKDVAVSKGHTKTITLSEVGTFHFHDDQLPQLAGSFAVVNN